MKQTAVVILNWNGISFLQKFLPTLVKNTQHDGVSVVIADNGSTDNSSSWVVTTYPDIRIIQLDKNYGFTGGYNRALAQIDSDYFILLNSDIEVTPGWIEPLIDGMENNADIGVSMPKILSYQEKDKFEYAGGAGGFIDYLGYPFCRGRILSHIETDKGQYNTEREVFWATGAAMVVRSSLYKELGGLDDLFFAHMEEIDFCWRAKLKGWKVFCFPNSVVYHVGGGSLPNNSPRKLHLNYRNNLLMLRKNLPKSKRSTIIFIRMCLDGLSAIVYLLQGKPSFSKSVLTAHREYHSLKHNITTNTNSTTTCVYKKSIILFFLTQRSKAIFSNIKSL